MTSDTMTFDGMWSAIEPIGREASSGGYRRYAWTRADAMLREWFAGEAAERGLDLVTDRAGNQWAWWGDPDAAVTVGRPGVVIGSHLDSVPDGGAFDGPLGVVSALAVVDALRAKGFVPSRPLAVANFVDEEGARFGIACGGPRLITAKLDADKARGLRDADGVTLAERPGWRGQPRRHHATGGPARPDARPCQNGAGRSCGRQCAGVCCHSGQGSSGTQWCQRGSVTGHRLAGRPRSGRSRSPGRRGGRGGPVRRPGGRGVVEPRDGLRPVSYTH